MLTATVIDDVVYSNQESARFAQLCRQIGGDSVPLTAKHVRFSRLVWPPCREGAPSNVLVLEISGKRVCFSRLLVTAIGHRPPTQQKHVCFC